MRSNRRVPATSSRGLAPPTSPSISAVPDGASTLRSMVHLEDLDVPLGPEPRRRCSTSSRSSAIPSEVLGARSTATCSAPPRDRADAAVMRDRSCRSGSGYRRTPRDRGSPGARPERRNRPARRHGPGRCAKPRISRPLRSAIALPMRPLGAKRLMRIGWSAVRMPPSHGERGSAAQSRGAPKRT